MRKIVCLLMCMVFISVMGTGCQGKSSRVTCAEGEVIVTFDSQGGNHINPIILSAGDRVASMPQPSRAGYVFTGWYMENGSRFMETVAVMESITVTASWVDSSTPTYLVTFDSDGGTPISPIRVVEGESFGTLPQPIKSRYIFGGWFISDSSVLPHAIALSAPQGTRFTETTPVMTDLTLKARWIDENETVFTVTFDSTGGSYIAPLIVVQNESLSNLPESIKEDYIFVGWFMEDGNRLTSTTPIRANILVKARWVSETPDGPGTPGTPGNPGIPGTPGGAVSYMVSFDSNGGSSVESMRVKAGGTLVTLPEPVMADMTFRGWFMSDGTPFYGHTPVNDNITVTARWSVGFIGYWINFDSNGGNPIDPIEIPEGGTAGTLPLPVREGYTFAGWYINDEHFTASTPVTQTITVVARWVDASIPVFTVSFDADGGTHVPSILVANAATVTPLPVSTKDGHVFLGWFMEDGNRFTTLTPVRADIPLKARWADTSGAQPVTIYKVTFHPNGGTQPDPIDVVAGGSLITLPESVWEGHVFKGWYTSANVQYKSYTPITSDIDLYALWSAPANNHTVDFDSGGGSEVPPADVQDGGSLGTMPVPEPPNDDDIFLGWFDEDDKPVGPTTPIDSDTDLHAKWAPGDSTVYTVTFDSNGGRHVEPMRVISGNTIRVQPEPQKDGYIFIGWFMEDGNRFTSTTRVYKDLTLKALWVDENTTVYTVTYDSNGGIPVASMKVAAGTSVVTVPEPTRQDHVFNGWFTGNGTVPFTGSTLVHSDITVTANWKTPYVGYMITFNSDGGSDVAPITVPEGGTAGTLPVPEKAGFDFNGWFMADGITVFTATTPVYSNLTLKASWIAKEVISFTVTFDSDGGSVVPAMKVEAGKTLSNMPSTLKSGYVFTGWFMADGNRLTVTTPIRADITAKAGWVDETGAVLHMVRFESNGGTTLPAIMVVHGESLRTLPEPSRTGSTFTGWYESDLITRFNSTTPVTADITLYAQWSTSGTAYRVSFDPAGGSDVASITVPAGGSLGTLPVSVRDGYIFGGWLTPNRILFGAATPVNADIRLTARWVSTQTTSYTVNFESNGGTPVGPVLVEGGQPLGFLPETIRAGYDLVGWFDENGIPVTQFTVVNRNMTATAKWVTEGATLYTVTFKADGGTEIPPIRVAAGGTLGVVPVSEKAGFNFAGWYWNNRQFTGSTPVNSDIEVTAKWVHNTVKVFKLSFEADGGSEVAPMFVEDGNAPGTLLESVKDGYDFAGWFMEDNNRLHSSTPIRADITAKAKWVDSPVGSGKGTYTVSFNSNQGSAIDPVEVEAGGILSTLPEPVRNGYTFRGWELNSAAFTSTTPVHADITLDAVWATGNPILFTVTFDADNGSAVAPVDVAANGTLGTLPVTEKNGYVFGGWYMNNGNGPMFSASTRVTADLTVKAKWFNESATLFTVSFDSDKGTPVPPVLVEQDTAMGWLPDSERTGYQLIGWYMADGNRFYESTIVRADIQVKASWHDDALPLMVTVTFHTDGSAVAPVKLPAGASLRTLPETVKAGSTWIGWYLPNGDKLTTQTLIPTDVAVTARWITPEIAYTVTFESNGGSPVDPVRIQNGGTLGSLPAPTRTGYVFAGWEKVDKLPFTASTPVTADITVYARWIDESVQAFLVTFDSQGGTLVPPIMVADGDSLGAIPVSEKDGHTFTGWFTREGSPFTEITPVRANITVTAKWVVDTGPTYTVTFNSAGGTPVQPRTIPAGDPVGHLPEPTRAGFTFDGWYLGNTRITAATPVNADMEIVAHWYIPPVYYTVTFYTDGGDPVPAPVSIQAGGTIGTMPVVTKPGHLFLGWYDNQDGSYFTIFTPVTADKNVTARWDDNATDPFVVFFDENGGMPVAPAVVPDGGTVKPLPVTTRDGFTFMGWKMDDGSRFSSNTPVRRTMTVTADWVVDTTQVYTVTFDAGPGSAVDPIKVVAGTAVGALPQSTRDNYIFSRWVYNNATFDANSVVTANITVTAEWKAPVYHTVTFEPNNGDTATTVTVADGGTVGSLPSTPDRPGYTFTGWFIENTTTPFTAATVITGNMTVNAGWNQLTYTVTFESNGTVVDTRTNIPSGTTITLPTQLTWAGHTFNGWFMTNGVQFTASTPVNANMTVTAKWTIQTRTVTFVDTADGSTVATRTVDYGDTLGALPTRTRQGYNFGDWLKADDSKLKPDEPIYSDMTVTTYWLPLFEKVELDVSPEQVIHLGPTRAVLRAAEKLYVVDYQLDNTINEADVETLEHHGGFIKHIQRVIDNVFIALEEEWYVGWYLRQGQWEGGAENPGYPDLAVGVDGTVNNDDFNLYNIRMTGLVVRSRLDMTQPGDNNPPLGGSPTIVPAMPTMGHYQLVLLEPSDTGNALTILGNEVTPWTRNSDTNWVIGTPYTLATMPNVSYVLRLNTGTVVVCGENGVMGTLTGSGITPWAYNESFNDFTTSSCVFGLYKDEDLGTTPAVAALGDNATGGSLPVREVRHMQYNNGLPTSVSVVTSGAQAEEITAVTALADGKVLTAEPGFIRLWSNSGSGWQSGPSVLLNGTTRKAVSFNDNQLIVLDHPLNRPNRPAIWEYDGTDWNRTGLNTGPGGVWARQIPEPTVLETIGSDKVFIGGKDYSGTQDAVNILDWNGYGWNAQVFDDTYTLGGLKDIKASPGGYLAVILNDRIRIYPDVNDNTTFEDLTFAPDASDMVFFSDDRAGIVVGTDLLVHEYQSGTWQHTETIGIGALEQAELLEDNILIGRQGTTLTVYFLDSGNRVPLATPATNFEISGTAREFVSSNNGTTVQVWHVQNAGSVTSTDLTMDGPHTFVKLREGILLMNKREWKYHQ